MINSNVVKIIIVCTTGHIDNDPNAVRVVEHDSSDDATVVDMVSHLQDDQVMYCLLRLTTTHDMSTTVKFVYVHW